MKRILLGLFTLTALNLGANTAKAQSFDIPHDTINTTYFSGFVDVHNDITIPGMANVPISWKVVNENFSSDPTWVADQNTINVCDNYQCYTNNNNDLLDGTVYTTTYLADSTEVFKASFNLSGANPGTHFVSIRVWSTSNPNDSDTMTFIVNKWATGTTTVTKNNESIVLYPNPVRDEVNVVFNDLDVKNIAVYNAIGKNMIVYRTAGSSAKLDISKFPGGIYFLRMSDAKGNVVATKRITKQ